MIAQQWRSLVALPSYVTQEQADNIRLALTRIWIATMGSEPADLESDLRDSRRWFDPVAQGQRLRRELSQLQELPRDLIQDDPGPPLTFIVDPHRRLVTPEGRCAMDLLNRLRSSNIRAITDAQLAPYDRLLATVYRDWGRHRLQSVVDLLRGGNKPLQIPAAAVVIALLVNRCTSERRALARFSTGARRDVVDHAFFAPVQAFADILAPKRKGNRTDPRLVSGWMLYEAKRRLGDGLVVKESRNGLDGKVWIQPQHEMQVIDSITRDLVRGHRTHATPDRFARAFDALVTALRAELPKLAGFGLGHERPPETLKLREQFLQSLGRQLAEVD